MSWAECLVQLHCLEAPKEAQVAFQEYEGDIIDMIGHQSYSRFLEQYTILLHTRLGNKASCSVKSCPSIIDSVGKPSIQMVSLHFTFPHVMSYFLTILVEFQTFPSVSAQLH